MTDGDADILSIIRTSKIEVHAQPSSILNPPRPQLVQTGPAPLIDKPEAPDPFG
jgi:hypothetical protein